jgi:hypothetical protein
MKTDTWQLSGVPEYKDGVLFPEFFELGNGFYDLGDLDDKGLSYMHLVNGTSSSAFLKYCAELENAGFKAGFSRDEAYGIFREYIGNRKIIYTYFISRTGQARIIEDNSSVAVADFLKGKDIPEIRDDTELMQFGLFIGEPVIGKISSCGMLYVIRTHDNRLFLVDGGENIQATDEALEEVMVRLRDMTKTESGEKINICCWFCTHAHDDHMEFFLNMLKKYGDILNVERILFNFPNREYLGDFRARANPEFIKGAKGYYGAIRAALDKYCPNVVYLRPHTGERFTFSNLTVDVLQTHEDLFYENEKNVCIPGLNTTSTILKLSFDGRTLLILGDCDEENGNVLQKYYLPHELSCNYLQAAHHLANRNENIYSYVKADTVLIPQSRLRTHKVRRNHYAVLCKYYDRDRFYLQGDYTVVFRVKEGEEEQITYHQLMGRPFEEERDGKNILVDPRAFFPKKK